MAVKVQKEPFKRFVEAPFYELAEFISHETELCAGMADLVHRKEPESRKLLVIVAGHAAYEAAFSVDHLVVRERKYEILGKCIHHGESQQVVMISSPRKVY